MRHPSAAVTLYKVAGVDIRGADQWLSRMGKLIRSTHRPGAMKDAGAFAGLFRLSAALPAGRNGGWRDPVLVASTDGVGTKLALASSAREHEAIGIDVVAMNVNDVITYGAQPLFFLDYLAVGRLQPALMSALLRGIVRGCRAAGCALLGGETAEMPGLYEPGRYDVAGFCVAAVDRSRLLDGSKVAAGDAIIGLASSGVHANGFSLVRRALSSAMLRRLRPQLMVPTRIYVGPVLQVLGRRRVHAIVHVTGGGLLRRIPALTRARPGLRAQLLPGSWPLPPVFRAIQGSAGINEREMAGTFNMGVGMALACPPQEASSIIRLMRQAGIAGWLIGSIRRE